MVEHDEELPLGVAARQGFHPQHVRQERPMDAVGAIVRRGPPGAMIDAHRRGHIRAGGAGATAGLGRLDGVHYHPEEEGAGASPLQSLRLWTRLRCVPPALVAPWSRPSTPSSKVPTRT